MSRLSAAEDAARRGDLAALIIIVNGDEQTDAFWDHLLRVAPAGSDVAEFVTEHKARASGCFARLERAVRAASTEDLDSLEVELESDDLPIAEIFARATLSPTVASYLLDAMANGGDVELEDSDFLQTFFEKCGGFDADAKRELVTMYADGLRFRGIKDVNVETLAREAGFL